MSHYQIDNVEITSIVILYAVELFSLVCWTYWFYYINCEKSEWEEVCASKVENKTHTEHINKDKQVRLFTV